MNVLPYKNSGDEKKKQVEKMFDSIAFRYDLLNHLLSLGIDKWWRKKALDILDNELSFFYPRVPPAPSITPGVKNIKILDLATGTGDFIVDMVRRFPFPVTGVDISKQMLHMAGKKIKKMNLQNVDLITGDAEDLPFPDNFFDGITIGFGVRNFQNLEAGLAEISRVLKAPGVLVILEFSKPKAFLVKNLYYFYFRYILPLVGWVVSRDAPAYKYLPQSVYSFPEQHIFLRKLQNVGIQYVKANRLSFGIVTVYLGIKSF